jgi:5-methyltetrahydrofolate--homocysteine methyltransferase
MNKEKMDKNGKTRLLDALADHPLLGDGAMGTQLMLAGLEQGNCGEAWNLTQPEKVLAIQRRYAEAGSDCILTNTFGGSRIMLNRHSQTGNVVEINQAGVRIAREAFGAKPGFVIGDIGPFGGLMEPYGDFTEEQVRSAFNEQARALVDAGADAIIVETQTSLEELLLGIQAAKEAGAACIIGSMAYDVTLDGSTFRTMMGIDPERAAQFMQEHGADIVALNCGTGMDMVRARTAVERYRKVTSLPVMVQPNAGQPKLIQMKVVYDETPEHMVAGVAPLLDAGAAIVGGCCGSTPAHIRAFRQAMDKYLSAKGKIRENQAV